MPTYKLLCFGVFLLAQVIFASARALPSCEDRLGLLGAEHYDSHLPQAWELPARALMDYLSAMSDVSDDTLDRLRNKGGEQVGASCYGQWLFVTADALKLFVFDTGRSRAVAALDVIGFPKKVSGITQTVLALTLHQAVADAGDGVAVVDVQRGKVLYAPPPSRYGAVVPVLTVPGKGVLIEEADSGTGRLYRRLNFLELTESGSARLLEPGCVVSVPDDFSGQLTLDYALTDNGLVVLGDVINGKQRKKLLQNCRAVAERLY